MANKHPQVGQSIRDCYMSGVATLDNIGNKGVVEHVGSDYMIVRDKELDKPIFVSEEQYYCVEELND
jgi:hypothetical protein